MRAAIEMMNNDEAVLGKVFEAYRNACPDVDASPLFMPTLWQKIEARHSFWSVFQGFARTAMGGCAALALLLLVLNMVSPQQSPLPSPSYTDALVADHSVETTYYAETVRARIVPDTDPQ